MWELPFFSSIINNSVYLCSRSAIFDGSGIESARFLLSISLSEPWIDAIFLIFHLILFSRLDGICVWSIECRTIENILVVSGAAGYFKTGKEGAYEHDNFALPFSFSLESFAVLLFNLFSDFSLKSSNFIFNIIISSTSAFFSSLSLFVAHRSLTHSASRN